MSLSPIKYLLIWTLILLIQQLQYLLFSFRDSMMTKCLFSSLSYSVLVLHPFLPFCHLLWLQLTLTQKGTWHAESFTLTLSTSPSWGQWSAIPLLPPQSLLTGHGSATHQAATLQSSPSCLNEASEELCHQINMWSPIPTDYYYFFLTTCGKGWIHGVSACPPQSNENRKDDGSVPFHISITCLSVGHVLEDADGITLQWQGSEFQVFQC